MTITYETYEEAHNAAQALADLLNATLHVVEIYEPGHDTGELVIMDEYTYMWTFYETMPTTTLDPYIHETVKARKDTLT